MLILPIFLLRSLPYRLRKILRNHRKTSVEVSEDLVAHGFVGKCLDVFFAMERSLIKKFGYIPFGGSLIVRARKKQSSD